MSNIALYWRSIRKLTLILGKIYIFLDPFTCNFVRPKASDKFFFLNGKIRPCLMYRVFLLYDKISSISTKTARNNDIFLFSWLIHIQRVFLFLFVYYNLKLCLSIYLSRNLHIYLSIFQHNYLSIYLQAYIFTYKSIFTKSNYLSTYMFIYLTINLIEYIFIYLSNNLHIYLSRSLSNYLSIDPYDSLFIHNEYLSTYRLTIYLSTNLPIYLYIQI